MTKPTGRPRGRPKTKEYVTLMARVDITLAERVKRYAAIHRQPISVVLRDALTLLMEEYPSGADLAGPHRLAAQEFLSDRYESPLDMLVGEIDSAGVDTFVSDTNGEAVDDLLAEGERQPPILSDTKEMMSDRNQETAKSRTVARGRAHPRKASDTKAVLPAPSGPAILSDTNVLAFDTSKYSLGKLCPRGHDYHGTGQTLRRLPRHICLQCDKEQTSERRQAKRATVRPLQPPGAAV